eukprot:Nk52_evm17s2355 gene=Nk52_evmTU17s2355
MDKDEISAGVGSTVVDLDDQDEPAREIKLNNLTELTSEDGFVSHNEDGEWAGDGDRQGRNATRKSSRQTAEKVIKKSSIACSLARLEMDFFKKLTEETGDGVVEEEVNVRESLDEGHERKVTELAALMGNSKDEVMSRLCAKVKGSTEDGSLIRNYAMSCASMESADSNSTKQAVAPELPPWLTHLAREKLLFQMKTREEELPWFVKLCSKAMDEIPRGFFWLRKKGCEMLQKDYQQPTDTTKFDTYEEQKSWEFFRNFIKGMLVIEIFSGLYSLCLHAFGFLYAAICSDIYFLMNLGLMIFFGSARRDLHTLLFLHSIIFCWVLVMDSVFMGGLIGGGYLMFGTVEIPMLYLMVFKDFSSCGKACIGVFICVAIVCILEVTHVLHEFEIDKQLVSGIDPKLFTIGYAYITLVALTSTVYGWFTFQTLSETEATSRAQLLLENVLPYSVQSEFKQAQMSSKFNAIYVRSYECVTIFFCDMVSFTTISSTMSPEVLVYALNYTFCTMDTLTSRFGVEKIKTIGDCYMAAAGLFEEEYERELLREKGEGLVECHKADLMDHSFKLVKYYRGNHAQRMCRFALMVRDVVGSMLKEGFPFRMRFGLHTGPVVAGVIGQKKFQFDIWGDSVNTASRMESNGIKDNVNVSSSCAVMLDGRFVLYEREENPEGEDENVSCSEGDFVTDEYVG